jgi:preprotein translocase subunit SecE
MDKDKEKEPKDVKRKSALATAVAKSKTAQPKSKGGGLREYFKGVKVEIRKVVWPTRKELLSYTWTVLVTCFAFGVAIWLVDSIFAQGLKLALGFSF